MIYIALGVLLLVLVYGGRRAGRAFSNVWAALSGPRRVWRPASGLLSVILLTLAFVMLLRDAWLPALGFGLASLGLASAARFRKTQSSVAPQHGGMTEAEARAILGVAEGATPAEIQAAYRRLMRSVHPDAGGTVGLAAQLNAARQVLRAKS